MHMKMVQRFNVSSSILIVKLDRFHQISIESAICLVRFLRTLPAEGEKHNDIQRKKILCA